MKLYIKTFFITGVPFGVCMGLMGLAGPSLEQAVETGTLAGVSFGFAMSILMVTFHNAALKANNLDGNENSGPHQIKSELIEGPLESVYEKSLIALSSMNATVKVSNKNDGFIEAKTSRSWKSFGEQLSLRLVKESDEKVLVTFSSSPWLKTTLVDYGKGIENVNSFFSALKS